MYDFGREDRVDVYASPGLDIDLEDPERRSDLGALLSGMRFRHSVETSTLTMINVQTPPPYPLPPPYPSPTPTPTPPPPLPLYQVQSDMPDELYEGKLEIGGKDTFFVTWAVQGPRTTGQIVTMFTRDDSDRMDV